MKDTVKKEWLKLMSKADLIERILKLESERRAQEKYISLCKQKVTFFKDLNKKMNRLTPIIENDNVVRIWKPKVF